MRSRIPAFVLVGLVLATAVAPGGAAQAPPGPVPARIADVAWMAGHWRGEIEGAVSEEVWAAPEGDTMIGMWRLVLPGGKARVLELLLLREDGEGVTLYLRHFDPQLVAREEKDRPLALRLVRRGEREAAFEGPAVAAYGGSVRIEYRRPSEDLLVSVLERAGKREEFRFTRKAP